MDDIIVRPRNPRYNIPNRLPAPKLPRGRVPYRKKEYGKDNGRLAETIIKQLVTAVIIFLLVFGIKSIKTPFTNYLSDKAGLIVSSNIDFEQVYSSIDATVKKINGDITDNNNNEKSNLQDADKAEASLPTEPAGSQGTDDLSGGTEEQSSVQNVDYSNYDEKDSVDAADTNSDTEGKKGTGSNTSASDSKKTSDYKKLIESIKSKYSFLIPVNGSVTSPFGERVDPIKNVETSHRGIDIAANKGVSIKAALDGTVIVAGVDDVYGNYIKLDHSNGVVTLYAHCSKLVVKKGQKVKKGAVIGYVGETGAAIGPHLHFEIVKDGNPINPLEFIKLPLKE
jgi:murein DD-endopeptidase MepM/ murein hydrolase activator NlpD